MKFSKPNHTLEKAATLWLSAASISFCAGTTAAAETDWIAKSNVNTQILLDAMGELSPEDFGSIGVEGVDENITDRIEGWQKRAESLLTGVLEEFEGTLASETDRRVKEDLNILIDSTNERLLSAELNSAYLIPYMNVGEFIFNEINSLLRPTAPSLRYPAAVVRMQRYAGLEEGYEPLAELVKMESMAALDTDGLMGPFRGQVERDIEISETFITGIEDLFVTAELDGWQAAYSILSQQLRNYTLWVEAEILPRARNSSQLPPDLYALQLSSWGIKADPNALIERGLQE
ncbi:Bacterial protein of unknown function (DUF885) [Seminavis robusta]|uniref:Uncharacterized protein n=1 Tax=Seminavis robusta TaxID=568900 RepID=A0A9N8HN33_9STRA|nr:Bacterial protein of unknown function (DUF885) [Seminavis robusta]|eukprot:Sro952_g224120.1 Bacterial protein of unknown function (DUF885) (290) ;mRNA; r:34585-35454